MTAKNALVVDDSKSARFALRRYLEGHQYRVDAVESAAEALNFLAANHPPPQVIFLDHVMPGMDGFEALRMIKSDSRLASIPVVICSSSEGPQLNAEAQAAGASGVLQKPPNREELGRILDALSASEPIARFTPTIQQAAGLAIVAKQPPASMDVASMAAAPPVGTSGAALNTPGRFEDAAIRELLEGRLKKVSQGLFTQFAEIKTAVGHLASQQVQLAEAPANLRGEFRMGLDETNQALRLVTSRIEALEREMFGQLTSTRTQMEAMLKSHSDRVSEIVQFARQAATDEAQVVAERTVMSAAIRISDQLSDAILGAVGRR
ncbi:MAG: response regulator [Panacagrimonas sp.]